MRDECHKGAKWLAKLLEVALGADVKLVQVGQRLAGVRGGDRCSPWLLS